MSNIQELPAIKKNIFLEIETAARNGDIAAIDRWKEALEECEKFIRRATDLEGQIEKFNDSLWKEHKGDLEHTKTLKASSKRSPRQEGKLAREKFLNKLSLKGIKLQGKGKEFIYNRRNIGIAFANDCKPRPHSWFLGLKDKPTDIAVLLCQEKNGFLHELIIPFYLMPGKWDILSQSNNQVKFHIYQKHFEFILSLPGGEEIKVTKYLGNYDFFMQ